MYLLFELKYNIDGDIRSTTFLRDIKGQVPSVGDILNVDLDTEYVVSEVKRNIIMGAEDMVHVSVEKIERAEVMVSQLKREGDI